jgi:hypothetical protein
MSVSALIAVSYSNLTIGIGIASEAALKHLAERQ